ncbi:MAG: GFA family protein [Sulfitobacter sp.]|nr:GFA family protein [Sulfitobacter sp.]
MVHLEGRCLCGAVTVSADAQKPMLRACHCDMCRRQNSSAFVSIATNPQSVEIDGPVKVYRSSEWAERGFCPECGSTLYYAALHDGVKQLAAGLFDNAGGAPLKLEFFVDRCPQGYAFAGDHKRLTTADTIALFAPKEGEDQ